MDVTNIRKGMADCPPDVLPEEDYVRTEWKNVLFALSLGAYQGDALKRLVTKLKRNRYEYCLDMLVQMLIITGDERHKQPEFKPKKTQTKAYKKWIDKWS